MPSLRFHQLLTTLLIIHTVIAPDPPRNDDDFDDDINFTNQQPRPNEPTFIQGRAVRNPGLLEPGNVWEVDPTGGADQPYRSWTTRSKGEMENPVVGNVRFNIPSNWQPRSTTMGMHSGTNPPSGLLTGDARPWESGQQTDRGTGGSFLRIPTGTGLNRGITMASGAGQSTPSKPWGGGQEIQRKVIGGVSFPLPVGPQGDERFRRKVEMQEPDDLESVLDTEPDDILNNVVFKRPKPPVQNLALQKLLERVSQQQQQQPEQPSEDTDQEDLEEGDIMQLPGLGNLGSDAEDDDGDGNASIEKKLAFMDYQDASPVGRTDERTLDSSWVSAVSDISRFNMAEQRAKQAVQRRIAMPNIVAQEGIDYGNQLQSLDASDDSRSGRLNPSPLSFSPDVTPPTSFSGRRPRKASNYGTILEGGTPEATSPNSQVNSQTPFHLGEDVDFDADVGDEDFDEGFLDRNSLRYMPGARGDNKRDVGLQNRAGFVQAKRLPDTLVGSINTGTLPDNSPFPATDLNAIDQPDVPGSFVISPGGLTSPNVRVNAIYNENNDLVLGIQNLYLFKKMSKWVIKDITKDGRGVLFLAGTQLFAHSCYFEEQKTPWYLSLYDEVKGYDLAADKCPRGGVFLYRGWKQVESVARRGNPAGDAEIVFLPARLPSTITINRYGLFGNIWPRREYDWLWDVRRDEEGKVRFELPKFGYLAVLPTKLVDLDAKGTMPMEARSMWLYKGTVFWSGNPLDGEQTVERIEHGARFQIHGSTPETYPLHWYLAPLSREQPDPFNFGRDKRPGVDVVLWSLQAKPKPFVWVYKKYDKDTGALDERIFLMNTDRFLYLCRDPYVGGKYLRLGNKRDAELDCEGVTKYWPIKPEITQEPGYGMKIGLKLGNGLLWIWVKKETTDKGVGFDANGMMTMARLTVMTKDVRRKIETGRTAEALKLRNSHQVITEAVIVKVDDDYQEEEKSYKEIDPAWLPLKKKIDEEKAYLRAQRAEKIQRDFEKVKRVESVERKAAARKMAELEQLRQLSRMTSGFSSQATDRGTEKTSSRMEESKVASSAGGRSPVSSYYGGGPRGTPDTSKAGLGQSGRPISNVNMYISRDGMRGLDLGNKGTLGGPKDTSKAGLGQSGRPTGNMGRERISGSLFGNKGG